MHIAPGHTGGGAKLAAENAIDRSPEYKQAGLQSAGSHRVLLVGARSLAGVSAGNGMRMHLGTIEVSAASK